MIDVTIVGGGLAGCEAAYQLLKRGFGVTLVEMRGGGGKTPCHTTDALAELVCSNSLKSDAPDTASGLLKVELAMLDSLVLMCAREAAVPAGSALAVDRERLSRLVSQRLEEFDGFKSERREIVSLDGFDAPVIVATGPMTSDALAAAIGGLTGEFMYFYDAAAPIVDGESVNTDVAFWGARYGKGEADYLNCPMDKVQYMRFYEALTGARRVDVKDYERGVFEGCMPIEVMARRGVDTMRFGPLRPVGLYTLSGERPYAVVQLRREDCAASAFNLVGFQTNLKFEEQKRVFSLIPGLEDAEFLRYGVMHRNTYLNAPLCLEQGVGLKGNRSIFFAGQLTGVEGYMESVASGLTAALNVAARYGRSVDGEVVFPPSTMIGALQRYLTIPSVDFQPMNANFGILPSLENAPRDKKARKSAYYTRAINDMKEALSALNV